MNKLWEAFVLVSLKRNAKKRNATIKSQPTKAFWESKIKPVTIKPDIVIQRLDNQLKFVLDTKWKCPDDQKPSVDDLRQLYVYHHYYEANKVALIYPLETLIDDVAGNCFTGNYCKINPNEIEKSCSTLFFPLPKRSPEKRTSIKAWQDAISEQIFNWCGFTDNSEKVI